MALAKVIILEADPSAGRQLALGFQREGIASAVVPCPTAPDAAALATTLPLADAQAIVIGGAEVALIAAVRGTTAALPILYVGPADRGAARAAGADEAVGKPAFLRDIVILTRLLANTQPDRREHFVGQLGELTNVFSLVRAIAAVGRSATLTLMRGLRRGEVRFFHGEVTSAELGLIHGQAAFHQLLLWTEARFDLRHEDIVRRQQIPLTTEELLDDAEQFLAGIRESSGVLSPAMVLEQDVVRLHGLGKLIPTEVHGVLRMFDGHRVLADILEDSPYRVFETLRVAQRALEAGLLRVVQTQRPKATWRAVLAIEEWLVGADRDGVVEAAAAELDSGPIGSGAASAKPAANGGGKRKTKRNRKQRRANTPLPVPVKPVAAPVAKANQDIDWGALVPRAIGTEVGTLSSVVPVAQASGEIRVPTRELEREKLESVMNTGKRDRIFPSEIHEPKVVFDDGSDHEVVVDDPTAPGSLAKPRTRSAEFRDEQQDKVRALVKKLEVERMVEAQDARVRQDEAAEARRSLEARAAGGGSADARARLEEEVRARVESEETKAQAKAREAYEAKAREEAAARAKAREQAEARARAEQLAAEEAAAEAAEAAAKAATEAKARDEAAAKAAAEAATEAKAREEAEALAAQSQRDAAETARRVEADIKAKNAAATEAAAAKSLAEAIKGKQKVADEEHAIAVARAALAAAGSISATPPAATDAPPATEPQPAFDHGKGASELVSALVSESKTDAVTVAEANRTKVVVQDTLRVSERSTSTTEIHAVPVAMIKEDSHPLAAVPLSAYVQAPAERPAVIESAKPADDEPATNQFAKVAPAGDSHPTLPVAKPASAESAPTLPVVKSPAGTDLNLPPAVESSPTLPVAEPAATEVATAETAPIRSKRKTIEPVLDVATVAHDASAVVAAATHAALPPEGKPGRPRHETKPPGDKASPNIATPAHDREADQLRADAHGAFSDAEEAFFRDGHEKHNAAPARVAPVESFDDLDEGYQPVGFWDRLMGRKKPKQK